MPGLTNGVERNDKPFRGNFRTSDQREREGEQWLSQPRPPTGFGRRPTKTALSAQMDADASRGCNGFGRLFAN